MTAFSVAADILEGRTTDALAGLDWREWHQTVFPQAFTAAYTDHHEQAWDWTTSVQPDKRPTPFFAAWPRGHAKSTWLETSFVYWGATKRRNYGIYVCGTQEQADDHVENIATILEGPGIETHYPAMADRELGKYGNSRGWRRNRLRTRAGYIVDAMGLDTARGRGKKLAERRPDHAGFDDIDDTEDSPAMVAKKLRAISRKILPSLFPWAAIGVANNFTHPNAIAVQIADRTADILMDAIVSGPFPAIEDMAAELVDGLWKITGGTPTWPEGFGVAACEAAITTYGYTSFIIESQQDIAERPGALLKRAEIDHVEPGEVPELDRVVVAVDPNKTGRGDDAGVVVVGRGTPAGQKVPHGYVLADYSAKNKPSEWRDTAARAKIDWGAGAVIVESAGLGEHAELTIKGAPLLRDQPVSVIEAEAKLGKKDRARPIAQLYKEGRIHHVGSHPYLESQWTGWDPETGGLSPGAIDAVVHGFTHLLIDKKGPVRVRML